MVAQCRLQKKHTENYFMFFWMNTTMKTFKKKGVIVLSDNVAFNYSHSIYDVQEF